MDRQARLNDLLPIALTTTLGMQSMRVLLPLFQQYLRDTVGISSLSLAPIALGLFALAFLPGLLVRRWGLKAALGFTMGAIPLLRLAEQLSRSSLADIVLSALCVVLFWWFLACAYSALASSEGGGRVFPLGILAGLALDTAVHAGAGTLDLSWQPGFAPLGIVLLLAGVSLTAAAPWRDRVFSAIGGEPGLLVPRRMSALGAWLILEMMVFQNVARAAAAGDLGLAAAGLLVTTGNAIALLAAGLPAVSGRRAAWAAGLLIALLMLVPVLPGWAGIAWLVAGNALAGIWLVSISAPRPDGQTARRILGGTFGPAALISVLAAFLYYASYDLPLGVRAPQLLPGYGALLFLGGLAGLRGGRPPSESRLTPQPALAAALLVLLPLGYGLALRAPEPVPPPPGNGQVRVMTYNLHQGFNTGGQLDVEALARQIEDGGADIVALQEIPRGYLTAGSLDLVSWLSKRLGMPYFFGPASDFQWGNALLSRYPILAAENVLIPPDDLLLRRSYIRAAIDLGGGTLTVIATHLHHQGSEVRGAQVRALLAGWDGAPATVILGDLNARPDTPEMALLADAGLLNASALTDLPAFTFPSTAADREIDYAWYSPDLTGSDFRVYLSTASDHLPVAVTLTLP